MGILNFDASSQFLSYSDNPIPHARMFVFHAGKEVLAPIFSDRNLTFTVSNPLASDESGLFKDFFLTDGSYRIVVVDESGHRILEENDIISKSDSNKP